MSEGRWLLITGLTGAYFAGWLYLRAARTRSADGSLDRRSPHATLTLALVIALAMMLQLLVPSALSALERDATRIASGEWWRLVTALFVQNGGVAGSLLNLVSLLLVGSVAEYIWGARRWLMVFVVGGILSEVVALAWQPIGAGNSVANFSLAGAVSILCLVRRPTRPVLVAAGIALGGFAALLLLRDIHGAAALIGVAMGLIFIRLDQPD